MTNTEPSAEAGAQTTNTVEIENHPLVDALVPDPASPPSLTLLISYAEPSNRAEFVRLYLDPDLEA